MGFFVLYVMVAVLVALNIITAIFVNDALEMARLDKDMHARHEVEENRAFLQTLKDVFKKIDIENKGTISSHEFSEHMERDEVKMQFVMLGLDVSDPETFFQLLDVDGSVGLEIDEFVMGCMRFRGNPSNVNMECSILESKQLLMKSITQQKRLGEKVAVLEKHMVSVCDSLGINSSSVLPCPHKDVTLSNSAFSANGSSESFLAS